MKALRVATVVMVLGGGVLAAAAGAEVLPWKPVGISSPLFESHPAFDPRTGDLYFVRSSPEFTGWRILVSRCTETGWSTPEPPAFAGDGVEADPYFTADGSGLYFIATRSVDGVKGENLEIWRIDRDAAGAWGAPARLPEPVNSPGNEWFPRPGVDGWLYFGSDRPGGLGGTDIWRARADAAGRWTVENLGAALNTPGEEYEPLPVLAIAEWEVDPEAPHLLAFTDLRTGRVGVLGEAGEDELTLAAGLMSGDEAARLRFERTAGRVTALTLSEPGHAPRRAERIADRAEEIAVDAGSAQLQGTLWLPPGDGPFPAVALVPAGALGRTATATFPNFFLAEGFAVLAYDRRPGPAPFQTYAADALAAVEALRRHPEVDPERAGLWGKSQGGWLALLAAPRSPSVAFVIDHAGMLVPAWQQELYRLAAEATADGVPPAVVQDAVAFETRLMRVAASGEGWPEIAAALAVVPSPPWHALVYKPASLAELQDVWRHDFSFDPRPFVAGIRQPVLALFGGLDRSTPIESAANLIHAIGPAGSVTVEFFPTANHAFLDAKTGGNAEIPGLSHFAPGMFETLRRWLERVAHAPEGVVTPCPLTSGAAPASAPSGGAR